MKLIFISTIFLLVGCTQGNMRACRDMCPHGVKSFDDKNNCVCQTLKDTCQNNNGAN